jgi:hypothetical protein
VAGEGDVIDLTKHAAHGLKRPQDKSEMDDQDNNDG